MRILVTGFEPFGGEDDNPTLHIISALQCVETVILPVSFVDAPKIALQKIEDMVPDAIILLGQAGGRAAISLERVALNIADAKNPDNDGYLPIGKSISEKGPSAYFCELPLQDLRDKIRKRGIPCHISNCAGTYVCNTLYYSVRHNYPELPAIFIHVPYAPQQVINKNAATPSMNIADMIAAVDTVIEFLKKFVA